MGGGVSLGGFCGSSMTESVKLLILFGGYKKVVIDAFSGASAGSISLAIMMRYLASIPEEDMKSSVDKLLAGLEHAQEEYPEPPFKIKTEDNQTPEQNDITISEKALDHLNDLADRFATKLDQQVQPISSLSDRAEFSKTSSFEAFKEWMEALCTWASYRLLLQLRSLRPKFVVFVSYDSDDKNRSVDIRGIDVDFNLLISEEKLQDAIAVQVVQEVGFRFQTPTIIPVLYGLGY